MTASGCSAACDAFDSGNVKVVVGLAPTAAVALKEKDRHGEGYAFVPVGQRRGRSPSSWRLLRKGQRLGVLSR